MGFLGFNCHDCETKLSFTNSTYFLTDLFNSLNALKVGKLFLTIEFVA